MQNQHKRIDQITVTVFLYCVSSLGVLILSCGARAVFGIETSDIVIVFIALLAGLLITSRQRVESLLKLVHKAFRFNY